MHNSFQFELTLESCLDRVTLYFKKLLFDETNLMIWGVGHRKSIPVDRYERLARREIEAETLPYCQNNNIGVIVYSH